MYRRCKSVLTRVYIYLFLNFIYARLALTEENLKRHTEEMKATPYPLIDRINEWRSKY